jgi:hypothetical protein
LPDDLLGPGLTARLDDFVAEARADAAAMRRRREQWLRHQTTEAGSLAGVLVDLAEQGSHVALHTRAGRVHHGRIEVVGRDFVVLCGDELPEVIITVASVCAVTARPGVPVAAGAREIVPGRTLAHVLEGLCGRRERVMLVADDGLCTVVGTLWSLGRDVITVRLDNDADSGAAYLPLAAIGEVRLA